MKKNDLKKTILFLLTFFLLVLVKQFLVCNIPIYAISTGTYDDMMMVSLAERILDFKWLGHYTQFTLVKGPFFPFLLALSNFVGIPYISFQTLLYSLSCAFFVFCIKDLFKSKYRNIWLLVIFTILLFNPVSFAFETLQRVYRNGITLSQVLVIFGGFIYLYLHRDYKVRKLLPISFLIGFVLASLWHTREDAIWIIPFVLVVIIILIGIMLYNWKKKKEQFQLSKLFCFLTPILCLFFITILIATINKAVYGVFTYNELNDSNFKDAMQSIYAVIPEENIQYVSVPRSKVKVLYEISPSLNSIQAELEKSLDLWSKNDRNPNDSEVEDGWFFLAFRDAVSNAGYHENAQKANQFYKQVSEEINSAIDNGLVPSQHTMPSALMSPWREGYLKKLMSAFKKIVVYVITFDKVSTQIVPSITNYSGGIDRFEAMTNNKAIYPDGILANGEVQSYSISNMQKYVDRLNNITKVYQFSGAFFSVVGVIAYIILSIWLCFEIKRKNNELVANWLALTGILLSVFVLMLGVSYNEIASCFSISYMYLSGTYPLVLAFNFIAIFSIIDKLIKRKGQRNDKKNLAKARN